MCRYGFRREAVANLDVNDISKIEAVANLDVNDISKICLFSLWVMDVWLIKQEIIPHSHEHF